MSVNPSLPSVFNLGGSAFLSALLWEMVLIMNSTAAARTRRPAIVRTTTGNAEVVDSTLHSLFISNDSLFSHSMVTQSQLYLVDVPFKHPWQFPSS